VGSDGWRKERVLQTEIREAHFFILQSDLTVEYDSGLPSSELVYSPWVECLPERKEST
jgi:hypothetical protein